MDTNKLQEIAQKMVTPGKGLLAADESNGSAGKRLASIGVENSEENRRMYRELFLGADGIEKYLSGVILFTETMRQHSKSGLLFPTLLEEKGILPGVKLDLGTAPLPGFSGEEITEGLDGLPSRAADYFAMGARFAKWRTVVHIDTNEGLPTKELIHLNATTQARYARICQEFGLVPIVEPEVILKGNHSIKDAEEITTDVVSETLYQCERLRVDLSALILKTSMVVPGEDNKKQASSKEVADATVRMLKASVPEAVPGIVFLSGGQEPEEATVNLNAIAQNEPLPWEIAFSYARAIQGPALEVWQGKEENIKEARKIFFERLEANVKADKGEY